MFEFLIDDLEGKPLLGDLENVGACYPEDDVIYMFGIPCRLSSARPTQDALGLPSAVVNHCVPVNGVHAPFCIGHETANQ
jgi:hypothetical protein